MIPHAEFLIPEIIRLDEYAEMLVYTTCECVRQMNNTSAMLCYQKRRKRMIPYHDTTKTREKRRKLIKHIRDRNMTVHDTNKDAAPDFRLDVEYILSSVPPRRHYVLK